LIHDTDTGLLIRVASQELYVASTKKDKMTISRSIVEAIRMSEDSPGRFLERDAVTELWNDVGDKKAVEKTSQALRDGAADLRKQLSDDMDPTFLSAVFDASPVSARSVASKDPLPDKEQHPLKEQRTKPKAAKVRYRAHDDDRWFHDSLTVTLFIAI
jgi:hypothetical protein